MWELFPRVYILGLWAQGAWARLRETRFCQDFIF